AATGASPRKPRTREPIQSFLSVESVAKKISPAPAQKKKAGALAWRRPPGKGSVLLRGRPWGDSIFPMSGDGNVTSAANRPTLAAMHLRARPLSFLADAGWRWWPVAAAVPACPPSKEAQRDFSHPESPRSALRAPR